MSGRVRFYEKKYPDQDELVMVRVKSIAEMGAYVQLLEYGNIEGMILLSELSRRRIRSVSKLIRIGRDECVVVLRVDEEKGYIDLSKRRVSPEDVKKCQDRFNKSKAVAGIMRHLAEIEKVEVLEIMEKVAWPLYKKNHNIHAYDQLRLLLQDSESVFQGLNIKPETQENLIDIVRKKLKPQPIKFRADFDVTCFKYDGIDAIKAALMEGKKVTMQALAEKEKDKKPEDKKNAAASVDPDASVKITLIAPPHYVMTTTTHDKDEGVELLKKALKAIEGKMKEFGGSFAIKKEPSVQNEKDEEKLKSLLDILQKKSKEVSGDDDDQAEEEVDDAEP